jgi:hypothetical protein
MIDWLRRVDPAFYRKEPHLLRTQAEIPRYGEEAQVEVRLGVLRADWLLRIAATIVALLAYFLIALPAVWTPLDVAMLVASAVVAMVLYRLRGRLRATVTAGAIGVLFGIHAHPFSIVPLAGMLAAGATLVGNVIVAREWRARPQIITWAACATLLLVTAYTSAFNASVVAMHLPFEVGAIALAYLGVCVIAGRMHRAELLARPEGVLSLPQSIVPLLDRSHDHAVICWLV